MGFEMETATRPPAAANGRPDTAAESGDQRIAIRDLGWDLYDRLSGAIGEHQHVYPRGDDGR